MKWEVKKRFYDEHKYSSMFFTYLVLQKAKYLSRKYHYSKLQVDLAEF